MLMITRAAAALALCAAPLAAQDAAEVPRDLGEKTFTLPYNEFTRIWLAGGETYRVEVEGTGIALRLAPVDEANEPPLVKPLLLGRSASGTALYTVQVRDDGIYTLRAVGGEAGRAVTVRIAVDRNVPKDKPKAARDSAGQRR